MADALTTENMSPQLSKVAERAKREPEGRFHALAHLIDEAALGRAFRRIRKDAAAGVDGVTKEGYGRNLEENLRDLHQRLKTKRYRHQPIRRVHLPKERGKTRPIGIATIEDKIVQEALREVLEAIYEQDFLTCSYGFRPERSAHDALRTLDRAIWRGEVKWILEADIQAFFDSICRTQLLEMLQERVADGSLLRLVGKCLHVGVIEGEQYAEPEQGTTQGSILSPLLGNVYLHYVLDQWFEKEVKPRLRGKATLVRYCDDFVIGFEYREDAERVQAVLPKRMGRYGLSLHPDKTRTLEFQQPPRGHKGSKGPDPFDFLGFTLYWQRTRGGTWQLRFKTRTARISKAIRSIYDWCRRHRHLPVKDQHAALSRRLQGHYNYFGVNGNTQRLQVVAYHARRSWYKWLCRRSQRKRLNWERFNDLLKDFPLPRPRVVVELWGTAP